MTSAVERKFQFGSSGVQLYCVSIIRLSSIVLESRLDALRIEQKRHSTISKTEKGRDTRFSLFEITTQIGSGDYIMIALCRVWLYTDMPRDLSFPCDRPPPPSTWSNQHTASGVTYKRSGTVFKLSYATTRLSPKGWSNRFELTKSRPDPRKCILN